MIMFKVDGMSQETDLWASGILARDHFQVSLAAARLDGRRMFLLYFPVINVHNQTCPFKFQQGVLLNEGIEKSKIERNNDVWTPT